MTRRFFAFVFLLLGAVAFAQESLPPAARKAAEQGVEAFQKGDLDAAATAFGKLLELAPDNPGALLNLGSVELRRKRYTEAEPLLKRATRLDPDNAQAWLMLGLLYCDQDKNDEALAALSQAVLLDPKNARAHSFLGVTVGKKGWLLGAEDELRKAIKLDNTYAEAHFNLALFYLQRTPPAIELARRHYREALELGAAPDPLVEKSLKPAKE